MAKKVSNVSFRIDTDIKNQADILFSELGLNMTTAFNIFLRQSIRERGIPFNITKKIPKKIPNKETISAMEDNNLLGPFNNAEEMMVDVLGPDWRKNPCLD